MAEVVLLHHIQGCTEGVRELARSLSAGGRHRVHTPDCFAGAQPATIDDGVELITAIGAEELQRRVDDAVSDAGNATVFAGISWGAGHAQRLAQTRPGAAGALLFESCRPHTGEWSFGPWPEGLRVQVHGMDADPFFALEGDIDAARALVDHVGDAGELHVYRGDRHLFVDSSLPSYAPEAAEAAVARSVAFLDRIDAAGNG